MFVIFSVFYILIAAAMTVLILLQNGAGADAGSGFGSGASATVFGARGSATFLTRATSVLATLFFLLSLGMGIYMHSNGAPHQKTDDLGVMAGASSKQKVPAGSEIPVAAPAASGNVVPAATAPVPAPAKQAAPAATEPAKKH
jgi:preprotein translocase subunit SecG